MAAFISICSWISIPVGEVPITLQTFGVFAAVGLLGGKLGTISVLIYVLLGTAGVPVFAGFSGGIGILVCNSGGYISGFIAASLVVWAMEHLFGNKLFIQVVSMAVGMIVCYLFGTIWFILAYTHTSGAVSFMTVLGWCVFPFILPDAVKIACAVILTRRIKAYVRI